MTGNPMSHDDARELLAALALDALDAADDAAMRAHLATCAACTAELAELRDATAAIAMAPAARGDAARAEQVKARLMARVSASKDSTLALPVPARRGSPVAQRTAIAAGLLLVVTAAWSATLWRDRAALQDTLALDARAADSLRVVVAERDKLITGLTGRDMALVRLTSGATHDAWALMFWNRATHAWTLVAHNLPRPAAGRTYQLWLVTANAKISAGTFEPGAQGEAVVRAVYDLQRDALKAVAVTDEPAGGVPQPTGPFVVIGTDTQAR
jgi:anti-sigma-K factor RskA/putative zinc finger protein